MGEKPWQSISPNVLHWDHALKNFKDYCDLCGMSPDDREEYWMKVQGYLPTKEEEEEETQTGE